MLRLQAIPPRLPLLPLLALPLTAYSNSPEEVNEREWGHTDLLREIPLVVQCGLCPRHQRLDVRRGTEGRGAFIRLAIFPVVFVSTCVSCTPALGDKWIAEQKEGEERQGGECKGIIRTLDRRS